jgi:hypothetical protein
MPITKAAAADKKSTLILLIPLRLATVRGLPNAFFRHLCGRAYFEKAVYNTCNPDIFHLKRGEQSGIPGYGKSRNAGCKVRERSTGSEAALE